MDVDLCLTRESVRCRIGYDQRDVIGEAIFSILFRLSTTEGPFQICTAHFLSAIQYSANGCNMQ